MPEVALGTAINGLALLEFVASGSVACAWRDHDRRRRAWAIWAPLKARQIDSKWIRGFGGYWLDDDDLLLCLVAGSGFWAGSWDAGSAESQSLGP